MNSQTVEDDLRPDGGEDVPVGTQVVIRPRDQHCISRRGIDKYAQRVLLRLTRNGYTAYLVGGGVRDLLLGRKPKDFDISTDAKPEEIRALFRNCILIGRRFRLAHIRFNDQIIETSTFRRTPVMSGDPTDPDADLFQRDDNLFGTPEEDALRRDFTVNGLFYDIKTFSVIDYVGGMEDLAARRIRSIGDPCIRFREDPVRMVRAIRFASRLDFDFDPDTLEAIRKHKDELVKASPARLLEEIIRLFAFSSGEKAVRLLASTGLLRVVLPELADWLDDKESDTGLFWRRLRALDAGDTVMPDASPALIFATLLADPVAACLTNDRRPSSAKPKYDKIRSYVTPIGQRLRFPRKMQERIVYIFSSQHRFFHAGGKKGQVSKFVLQDYYHEALALAELNVEAEGGDHNQLDSWRDLLAERMYGREDLARDAVDHGDAGHGEEGGQEAPSGDKKLSRSARRRRNKQRNRRLRRDAERAGQTSASAAAAAETPADAEVAAVTIEPVRPPTPPMTADPAVADAVPPVEVSQPDPEKAKKSSRRRRPSRKKDATPQDQRRDEATGEDAPAPAPLTAAAFYQPPPAPPEPDVEAKPKTKRTRTPRKKKSAEVEEPTAGVPPKPLPMDRADEAEIPMHWLDEI